MKKGNSILYHGKEPEQLIESILRSKIYNTTYWKTVCFGITAETFIDLAVTLRYIGGTIGSLKQPTRFMCLLLKLLQLAPDSVIVNALINNEEFKYIRLLGALYIRLTGTAVEIYEKLDPLLKDYRKVRYRASEDGSFKIMHVDEVINLLRTDNYAFDIALPYLQPRHVLVRNRILPPRKPLVSLEYDSDDDDRNEEEEEGTISNNKKLKLKDIKTEQVEETTAQQDCSIEETNRMRAALGLKPLYV